jgi:DNA-directed RNA polymerase specialized sigma24 family protein
MTLERTIWTLTPDAFERLLSSFNAADRERAGQEYEILRRKLFEFFAARGSRMPDECADETLNRVARKIAEGEAVENINKYCYGVARLVWMEVVRSRGKEPVAFDDEHANSAKFDAAEEQKREEQREEKERQLECFEECLSKLTSETRDFIIDYYREEKGLKIEHRKAQAARLQTTLNAMRLRASRLRRELAACIESCLSRAR